MKPEPPIHEGPIHEGPLPGCSDRPRAPRSVGVLDLCGRTRVAVVTRDEDGVHLREVTALQCARDLDQGRRALDRYGVEGLVAVSDELHLGRSVDRGQPPGLARDLLRAGELGRLLGRPEVPVFPGEGARLRAVAVPCAPPERVVLHAGVDAVLRADYRKGRLETLERSIGAPTLERILRLVGSEDRPVWLCGDRVDGPGLAEELALAGGPWVRVATTELEVPRALPGQGWQAIAGVALEILSAPLARPRPPIAGDAKHSPA